VTTYQFAAAVARRRARARRLSHHRPRRALRASGASYLWLLLVLIWALVQFVPVMLIFYSSFRSTQAIFANPLGVGGFEVSNFSLAWHGAAGTVGFSTYLRNTAAITVLAVLFGLSSGTLAAYGISRQRAARWSRILYALFLFALAMPYEILVIPLYQLLEKFQLLNSDLGAGLVYGALLVPTTAVIMRAFFDAFPPELLEAARVDGASEIRTFARIVLPLTRGGLLGVLVLSIVYIWGEVELAVIMLTLPQAQTVAVGMLSFQGQYFTNEGALFAGLTLASLPLIVLYAIFQRYVTRGLAAGALK
jgi:ABC-type glycerol-3-phosphate transport system permease component